MSLKDKLTEDLKQTMRQRQLSREEIGATSPAQMGQVMHRLMPLTQGKADGKLVNQMVKELLVGKT